MNEKSSHVHSKVVMEDNAFYFMGVLANDRSYSVTYKSDAQRNNQ